jgi:hypothetical protein
VLLEQSHKFDMPILMQSFQRSVTVLVREEEQVAAALLEEQLW